MTGWIDELARAFGEEPLSGDEADELLRVARDVAHRVERRATPLAAFLVGMRVATHAVAGAPRAAALTQAVADIDRLLPPAPGKP
jgi:hypothetical protein